MRHQIPITNGRVLHAHFANNRGRGNSNCTLTLCKESTRRPDYTRQYQEADILSQTTTSAWRGKINLSTFTLDRLGLNHTDLQEV